MHSAPHAPPHGTGVRRGGLLFATDFGSRGRRPRQGALREGTPRERGLPFDFRPLELVWQRLELLSLLTWTSTTTASDSDMRRCRGVAHMGCKMYDTAHVRRESGMGFAILLGDGTLCRERNVFLPTRLYLELYRHAVDRLPLTVPHRDSVPVCRISGHTGLDRMAGRILQQSVQPHKGMPTVIA